MEHSKTITYLQYTVLYTYTYNVQILSMSINRIISCLFEPAAEVRAVSSLPWATALVNKDPDSKQAPLRCYSSEANPQPDQMKLRKVKTVNYSK